MQEHLATLLEGVRTENISAGGTRSYLAEQCGRAPIGARGLRREGSGSESFRIGKPPGSTGGRKMKCALRREHRARVRDESYFHSRLEIGNGVS